MKPMKNKVKKVVAHHRFGICDELLNSFVGIQADTFPRPKCYFRLLDRYFGGRSHLSYHLFALANGLELEQMFRSIKNRSALSLENWAWSVEQLKKYQNGSPLTDN